MVSYSLFSISSYTLIFKMPTSEIRNLYLTYQSSLSILATVSESIFSELLKFGFASILSWLIGAPLFYHENLSLHIRISATRATGKQLHVIVVLKLLLLTLLDIKRFRENFEFLGSMLPQCTTLFLSLTPNETLHF